MHFVFSPPPTLADALPKACYHTVAGHTQAVLSVELYHCSEVFCIFSHICYMPCQCLRIILYQHTVVSVRVES
jgi:hypothetical protein